MEKLSCGCGEGSVVRVLARVRMDDGLYEFI
jgi:hypothetical protein